MTVSQFSSATKPAVLPPAADESGAPKGLQKGQQTRTAIVQAALGLATQIGLEGLSIGAVAEVMRMSKSGVFAHFGSREELQISVIREYYTRFEDEVFTPALAQERGLPLAALIRAIDEDRAASNLSSAVRLAVLKWYQQQSATVASAALSSLP